ncbi:MAG: GrpB family protein [Phycisphaerae bacterium]|nr:GrpB family protein [Phycisphaerae bacterium]
METLQEKIDRVLSEHIELVPYNPIWPEMFESEKRHLENYLPKSIIKRIEHFGSTAVPQLCAKPIIDMLVEVTSLEETKKQIVPILEGQGYDYFWRPTFGDDTPPFYAWFIKRDLQGHRTHHIHMVEKDFEHWERLLFRDYLITHSAVASQYGELKRTIADKFGTDRIAYTQGKTEFITKTTQAAKEYYRGGKGLS